MPKTIEIKLPPEFAQDENAIKEKAAIESDIRIEDITHVQILRKSLDARKRKNIVFQLRLNVYKKGEEVVSPLSNFTFNDEKKERTCHIVGLGPAGIFAALQCLELGIKPIVLERGKSVEERIKDISAIHKKKVIDKNSNYCFGEGGAGTYSDGKLYTRSKKRGSVQKVLGTFIQHGADENIGYEAHPHIGTNKLPKIVASMRKTILDNGGEIHFDTQVTDFVLKNDEIQNIICADGKEYDCQNVILATGHSARDIFELLDKKNIDIEAKSFALGVRIEHAQSLIDQLQYKQERGKHLPPSSYSLVTQAFGRGVFSFCMCPGGVIAPAATDSNEIVVNGWSSSARNGHFSNSGLVVEIRPENWQEYAKDGALAALSFQKNIEQDVYQATQSLEAPAQRVEDFIQGRVSRDLLRTSYQPGLQSHDLREVLPDFVADSLRQGLIDFGKKMRGYRTNDAQIVAVESRSSSPIRIPRERDTLR
ncbi:MAG: NAD(P)/FAD-dependent oxidoreductase, partial [Chitinophagales bacterium]